MGKTDEQIYFARTTQLTDERKIWVVFDTVRVMRGTPKQSRERVYARWVNDFGLPSHATEYTGVLTPAELSATITDIQSKREVNKDE